MTGEGLKIFGALCFVEEFVTTQANSIRRIFDGQLMFVNLQVLIDLLKWVIQRVPTLRSFWDLEKTVLHEIRVSGTVLWSPNNIKSPIART